MIKTGQKNNGADKVPFKLKAMLNLVVDLRSRRSLSAGGTGSLLSA